MNQSLPSIEELRAAEEAAALLTAEQARKSFLWDRAAFTLRAVLEAVYRKKMTSENKTDHKDCVTVLGKGVFLVPKAKIEQFPTALYCRTAMVYHCGKGRPHSAYWVEPRPEILQAYQLLPPAEANVMLLIEEPGYGHGV